MGDFQSYMICTSPRSGSTLLCKLLSKTGVAGDPNSLFHKPSLSAWYRAYQLRREDFSSEKDALAAVFDAARQKGRGETDVFGLRMQRESFRFFMDQVDVLYPNFESELEGIESAFGSTLFLHLSRADKLDQAISLIKAKQTGLWHRAADGTELERQSPPQEPFYDRDEIANQIKALTAMDEKWIQWFEAQKIEPMRISYDQLSEDPVGTTQSIVVALGLDIQEVKALEVPVAKLADTINEEWAERFLAEHPISKI